MDQIFGEIGKALAGFFGSPVVQLALQAIAIYLIILWLAGAYWAFRDMQQRTENPILPYVAASFIIVFTPIFFPLAIFVYKIIRPHEKIGEVYERNLAEEALLAEVEAIKTLPDLRPAGERGMDHLPDVPDAAQPRLPELQPARRTRLVALRVVRQGLRATGDGSCRVDRRSVGRRRSRPFRPPTTLDLRGRTRPPSATGRQAAARCRVSRRHARPGRARHPTSCPRGEWRRIDGASLSGEPGEGPPPGPSLAGPLVSGRPGLGLFTIEGRAAPGLFVVGWLATILGFALVVVGALAPSAVFVYFVGPALLTVGLVAGCGNQAIERRARGEAYAGPSPYLVFAAMIASVYAVGYPVGLALSFLLGPARLPDYVIRFIGVALQALIFVGVVRLTVVGTGALSWAQMGWRRLDGRAIRDLGTGMAYGVPIFGLTSILAAVLVTVFQTAPEAPLPPTGVAVGSIVQLIAGAVIAPLAEETVFRGFAVTAWRRTFGDRGALVRASLLFALAHVINVSGDNLPQVGGLIIVGFVTRLPVAFALGWLFLRRGSIWAPLGLHLAFNGIILILAEIATRTATSGG